MDRCPVNSWWCRKSDRGREWELARRDSIDKIVAEIRGEIPIHLDNERTFILSARADRIEQRHDGSFAILDYKTGQPPTRTEIELGFAPQLTLEAAMAAKGGFSGIAAAAVTELSHWRLSGSGDGGKISNVEGDLAELARTAYDGLVALLAHYGNDDATYPASSDPFFAPR